MMLSFLLAYLIISRLFGVNGIGSGLLYPEDYQDETEQIERMTVENIGARDRFSPVNFQTIKRRKTKQGSRHNGYSERLERRQDNMGYITDEAALDMAIDQLVGILGPLLFPAPLMLSLIPLSIPALPLMLWAENYYDNNPIKKPAQQQNATVNNITNINNDNNSTENTNGTYNNNDSENLIIDDDNSTVEPPTEKYYQRNYYRGHRKPSKLIQASAAEEDTISNRVFGAE